MWVLDRIKECVPFGVRSHIVAMEGDGWFDPILKIVLILNCNVRAFRYKRILFFMNCSDAGRFVRCGFVYVMVPRAAQRFIVYVLPRLYTCCRAVLRAAAHPWFRARHNASSLDCTTAL